MPRKAKKITVLFLLAVILPVAVHSQPSRIPVGYSMSADDVAAVLQDSDMKNGISFLSDTLCGGRSSGSYGAVESASWIVREFEDAGIMAMTKGYLQSFITGSGKKTTFQSGPVFPSLAVGAQSVAPSSYSLEIPAPTDEAPSPYFTNFFERLLNYIKSGSRTAGKTASLVELAENANSCASRPSAPLSIDLAEELQTVIETDRIPCHNIVGFLPGWSDKYVIIAAHYDNLGILSGKLYPGADSNASGVVSMLALARLFKKVNDLGKIYSKNIIFVALDAKQYSMAGAEQLWKSIEYGRLRNPVDGRPVTRDKISMFINLDIIGSAAAPIHSGRNDYLIMLSTDRDKYLRSMRDCNRNYNFYLDLAFDYYGSSGFTDMFLNRVSDQKVFIEHGIPAIMFTSGITMQTNKTEDTPDTIDLPVLEKRVGLIFRWLDRTIADF